MKTSVEFHLAIPAKLKRRIRQQLKTPEGIVPTPRAQRISCLVLFVFIASCGSGTEQEKKPELPSSKPEEIVLSPETAKPSIPVGKEVNCILEDRDNRYWFGTNDGAYLVDGKSVTHFTKANGLGEDQVLRLQEDQNGSIWFTIGGFVVSRFDGKSFTTFVDQKKILESAIPEGTWKTSPGDLWFTAFGGVYRYDGKAFEYLRFPIQNEVSESGHPKITPGMTTSYCILKDKEGIVWIGTQAAGVCRFDGKKFTWFREKGLAPPAVRAIFEDSHGFHWFGNNGYGLFRYDGKSLVNLTEENGLGNPDFFKGGKSNPGTLARIWSINEDDYGNLWIGTIDAGAWRFDGTHFTNYTSASGLSHPAVITIYKDKIGKLWFGTNGGGIFQFNGTSFTPWKIN